MNNAVKILENKVLSDQYYVLRRLTFERTERNGVRVKQVREVYDRGNGAAILLYNRVAKTVILTRQFRMPTFVNGNPTGMLIECCAGLLDRDNAEEAIRRETEEETGYKVGLVEKVMETYMSPGSVTEILYLFVAEYTKEMKVGEGGGLQDESEDIEVLEVLYSKAWEMVRIGEIRDAKTILLLQYAELNKLIVG
ncbi:MAG TPA: GDP-mannose pyrophosphatase NudK [Puia sp.]|jgi:nudix-type nucleoside diphosphatase (YffH/AdpP family)|nr:GDP-mannose pyrophosphatase NudK [Puia sp.]